MSTPKAVLEAARRTLQAEPHLRWAYLFGSAARGEHFRDVDIAIMPAASMPSGAVAIGMVVANLERAFGIKVDLVDLSQPDLPFVGPMLTERVVLLDREPQARRTWEADTTSRWLDFKPSYEEFLDRRNRAMRERLERQG